MIRSIHTTLTISLLMTTDRMVYSESPQSLQREGHHFDERGSEDLQHDATLSESEEVISTARAGLAHAQDADRLRYFSSYLLHLFPVTGVSQCFEMSNVTMYRHPHVQGSRIDCARRACTRTGCRPSEIYVLSLLSAHSYLTVRFSASEATHLLPCEYRLKARTLCIRGVSRNCNRALRMSHPFLQCTTNAISTYIWSD